jgi:catechol 2,3-dioxygenase-like lactoylglutathione lyase family enzyme
MEIVFNWVVPVLRIFDIAKADEFYQGFLGLSVDWDHRFDANAPLYRQISRGSLILHLTEHHGDGRHFTARSAPRATVICGQASRRHLVGRSRQV